MTKRSLGLTFVFASLALVPAFGEDIHWIGTWATAAQPARPGRVETFHRQAIRLIVRVSAGGKRLRVRLSNTYGDRPLSVGGAHVARRASGAATVPGSDR